MNEILYGTSCVVKKENDTSSGIIMILSLKGKKLVYLCVRHCLESCCAAHDIILTRWTMYCKLHNHEY